jgi:S-DNA-T family DNA segregation ATPase FtsK/SpoIIIE
VRDGRAPLPRLVVVVDEFASLVADLPRFVESLIDVGQRGRSLGVHLVLATQRPAGVVSESLRANTNLRISLRVLEPNDSRDVIGVTAAAFLSRRQPGRAIARLGAGEVVSFHAATVTGCSPSRSSEPVRIVDPCHSPIDETASPSDLARLVDVINEAHLAEGHAPPRRPWPDPLPATVALDALDAHAPDDDAPLATEVAYGLGDAPHEQRLVRLTWSPHRGPLLVHSLRGGGATTTLSTIAVALARAHAPSELYLYVLDLGPGDLAPLADLPHCGAYVTASETERGTRLLRWLDAEVGTRRDPARSERDDCPLVVLVVDQIGTIAAAEQGDAWREALRRLVADGAAVGVHVLLSTDRAGALGHATDALIEQRLLLRLAEPMDYAAIGRRGIDPSALPPGRGFLTPSGQEVQVAFPDRRGLAAAVSAIVRAGGERLAPPIGVLSSDIALSVVRTAAATSPPGWIIGLLDRTLLPAALVLAPGDHALVAGAARSGKSNALAVIAHEARRAGAHVHLLAPVRSPLHRHATFGATLTQEELRTLVDRLTTDEPGGPAHVIVVDDADLIDDEGELERLLAARPLHVHVIASARGDRLRATFRHWTAEIRRSRTGLLLKPDELDGELLGVRLPRGKARSTNGRGYLVTDQGVELVQVARIDPTAATTA